MNAEIYCYSCYPSSIIEIRIVAGVPYNAESAERPFFFAKLARERIHLPEHHSVVTRQEGRRKDWGIREQVLATGREAGEISRDRTHDLRAVNVTTVGILTPQA